MPDKKSAGALQLGFGSGKCRERGLHEKSRQAVVFRPHYIGTSAIVHEFGKSSQSNVESHRTWVPKQFLAPMRAAAESGTPFVAA